MAATEMFDNFNRDLVPKDREVLSALLASTRRDLLAARSEDERMRLVNAYMEQARSLVRHPKRGGRTA